MGKIDDISIHSIIGAGAKIAGDVVVPGFLRIDGDVDGNVSAEERVIIGEEARVRGNIRTKHLTVWGVVHGDIIASDSVKVLSSAVIIGSVFTKKISVAENVLIDGFCSALQDEASFIHSLNEYENTQAVHASALAQHSL